MAGNPLEQLVEKYERNGWPAQRRPDSGPAEGWSITLISSIGRLRSHTLSPDGKRIAFIWDCADTSDLYVMSLAGGWPARLTFDRDPVAYWLDDPPQWSPDGEWLAYTDKGHVWVVPTSPKPPGGLPRLISDFTTGASMPRWKPDGSGLLVATHHGKRARILLVDPEGTWPRQISQEPGYNYGLTPSPDGRYAAYVHYPPDDLNRSDIVVVELKTGAVHRLTNTPAYRNTGPSWSPDSKQIAFISERPGFREIFVTNVESGAEHQLTHAGCDLSELAWSPDGTRILCTINRRGVLDLAIVDVASGKLCDLHTSYGVHSRPQWLPDGKSVVYSFQDYRTPPDLFRMDVETRQITQLTFTCPPAVAALDMVKPEQVTYTSFDGLPIPALLIRPKKSNGAAIMYAHGGPTAQNLLEVELLWQYFVAKGYTWIAPDFRGSTGYGLDFERANHGLWGVDDTKDCLAGADYLVSQHGIDPERIAIFGPSYGSYLAVCALADDPRYRFACGVAKYGDCNILTSWAQTFQPGREYLEAMMGHPSEHREGYRAGSPVWRVENIQRPLLIVHGLLDENVHPLQSEELVEALSREGKTFEYKTYADEGHGILRRKNLIDFNTRLECFLDWYLL